MRVCFAPGAPAKRALGALVAAAAATIGLAAPAQASTSGGSDYTVQTGYADAFVAASNDIGNHCDDCTTGVGLPFSIPFNGTNYSTITASSNGNIQLGGNTNALHGKGCLPDSSVGNMIAPFWGDLRTDGNNPNTGNPNGIFTSTFGSAPNRVFVIDWRVVEYSDTSSALNFEVRFDEGSDNFRFVYGASNGGATNGLIGVQNGDQSAYTNYQCEGSMPAGGLNVTFIHAPSAVYIDDSAATYLGSWFTVTSSTFYNGSKHVTKTVGNRAKYTFTGTRVSWIASRGIAGGQVAVYIDGVLKTNVNLYSTTNADQQPVYTSPTLTSGTHTLKLKLLSGKRMSVDAFQVVSPGATD